MKKTFKPLVRVEKAFQTYRKKTLGVNDTLDIKHDSDDMENLQEYWSAAMSVIGESTVEETIDDTVVTEQSDTLFNINNIRKSIRENNAEALYKKSISKNNAEVKTESIGGNTENTLNIPERLSDDSDSRINLVELEEELVKEGKMEPTSIKNLSGLESFVVNPKRSSNLIGLKDSNVYLKESDIKSELPASTNVSANPRVEEEQDSKSYEMMDDDIYEFSQATNKINLHTEKKSTSKRTKNPETAPGAKEFDVSTVSVSDGTNAVIPLVCSTNMETGFINLKYMAYVDLYKSKNSFSLFVIKGKLEIVKNDEKKVLKKGSITVIEKDDVYSLACISENGACVVLTFCL